MLPIPTKGLSTEAMTKLSKANDNEYTLLYFPWHGSSPTIRATLAMYAKNYTFAHPKDWTSIKPNTPYGHLPVLYETAATGETLELAELSVIEFYLGKKFGLVGSNDWEEQLIRSHTNSSQALFDKLAITVIRAPKELQPQMLQLFIEKQIPEWALFHEQNLKKNGSNGHYVGDKMSVADLKTATILDAMRAISGDKFISREKTPAIMALYDHVQQDPKYAAWEASDQWKALTEETTRRFNLPPA
ncbi:hypothetical protein BGX21_008079 [Mortierella sp. AD011]|nr:hypothetical protein BGX20_008176 [Mortierella sp. AD010]KAF9398194.1 hypothetical protein BGX21_008079 [Mortierella sp. AD011]